MVSPPERLSEQRVIQARRMIMRQRQLIADVKACNGYHDREAELLAAFEKSLAIFEDDLATIRAGASDALQTRAI